MTQAVGETLNPKSASINTCGYRLKLQIPSLSALYLRNSVRKMFHIKLI